MASLDPEVAVMLGALITATTFSVGFLSTRVHRERGRAVDGVRGLQAKIAEAAHEGKAMDAGWFQGQYDALGHASSDFLDRLAAGLNVMLGLGVVFLAARAGVVADVDWGNSAGLLLVAFALTALTVVGVGTIDVLTARREVRHELAGTAVGQMYAADELVLRAIRRPTRQRLREARVLAERAVRTSHGQYAPAWTVHANAHLASLGGPGAEPDHLRKAQAALERAAALGPETAPMRAALARVREQRGEFERAAANWVRALWLYHEANRPLAATDETAVPTEAQAHAAGSSGPRSGSGNPTHGPFAWRFMPAHPRTFILALPEIPQERAAALFTATQVVTATGRQPGFASEASPVITTWLEHFLTPAWRIADGYATQLLRLDGDKELLAVLRHFRSADGPVGRERAREAERERQHEQQHAELRRRQEKVEREWKELKNRSKADDERRLHRVGELRDAEERRERIRRGTATAGDLTADEKLIEDAVARTRELLKPENRERECAELEARRRDTQKSRERWERQQAEWDEEWELMKAEIDRMSRILSGLATEDDMVSTSYPESEGHPWTEPDPSNL